MKKIISIILSSAILVCCILLSSCAKNDKSSDKLIVAVSIVPQETFVKAVCGDKVEVITMIPPGSSPANYEPTPAQVEKFSDCAVYFSIGVPTESSNILPSAKNINVVPLAQEVAKIYPDRMFEGDERDPHIWLSPKRARVMIEVIAEQMGEIDPDNKDFYKSNANDYIAELDQLDLEIKEALDGVQNRKFIVYHPAFGYLADDYGLEMFALEEEGKEATPQHLEAMIDLAKQEDIKVIFYQAEIDSSQSAAYAQEVKGKAMQLAPLSPDYINNLRSMANTMAEAMQ